MLESAINKLVFSSHHIIHLRTVPEMSVRNISSPPSVCTNDFSNNMKQLKTGYIISMFCESTEILKNSSSSFSNELRKVVPALSRRQCCSQLTFQPLIAVNDIRPGDTNCTDTISLHGLCHGIRFRDYFS